MPEPEQAPRPYVQVAAICQVPPLQEKNGQVSLIRLMDRMPVMGTTDDMRPQPLHNLILVVILKSGAMRGQYHMRIVPVTPSGKRLPGPELSVLFEGDERGVAAVLPLAIVAEEPGLF